MLASAVCQPSQSATRVRPLVSLPLLPPSRRSTCSRTRASAPLCPYPCFPRFPLFLPSPANSPLSVCPFVPLLAPSRSLALPLVPEESTSDTLQRFSLRVKTKKVNLRFAFFRCSRKVYPFLFLPYVFPMSFLFLPSPTRTPPCPFVPLLAPPAQSAPLELVGSNLAGVDSKSQPLCYLNLVVHKDFTNTSHRSIEKHRNCNELVSQKTRFAHGKTRRRQEDT